MKPDELRLVPNTMSVLQNYGEDVWIADGSERPLGIRRFKCGQANSFSGWATR